MRLTLALLFLLSAFTGFTQVQKQTSLWRTALFEPRKLPETIIEKAAKLQVGMDLKFLSLEAFASMQLAEFGIHKESGDVFLVDYVFDLKDPDARQACDAILSSNNIMKSLKLLEPFTKDKRLSEMVISDATLADQIVREDIGEPASEVRIHRVFKGLNKYNQENSLFKLGLGFFRYRDGSTYTEDNLTSYSLLNLRTRYLFTNFTKAKKRSLFFRGNNDSLVSSSGLFLVDRRERIRGIKDLDLVSI